VCLQVAAKQEKKKKAMMADLRNNIGGGEEAEEAEKVAAVSEIQLQTWLVTTDESGAAILGWQ
jgi:hypothetical protein